MEKITLYEELRFIEKSEPEVNGAWKGAHLLLFFLAFVFGSFCTFCFHMLMYLFDEKCVLFPKLLTLTSLRQDIIYEIVPETTDSSNMLPVDFISTQWVEKSACLLPTYVPLVSGIFGLVWTTMFLMCSTGSRVLTGLQRPWRVLPPVFVFSLAMSVLCVYTSAVTHYGLQELCLKLSEITGSTTYMITLIFVYRNIILSCIHFALCLYQNCMAYQGGTYECTYTVNVATLAYERRIRGVYQATRLTIFSAWFHTSCWVLSTFLALLRVLLAIDFKLVRISVQLRGNIDRMLEHHEKQIRTVSPMDSNFTSENYSPSKVLVHFKKKEFTSNYNTYEPYITEDFGNILFQTQIIRQPSELALVPAERDKLRRISACDTVIREHQFIVKMLYHLLDIVEANSSADIASSSSSILTPSDSTLTVQRQYGQQKISSTQQFTKQTRTNNEEQLKVDSQESQETASDIKGHLKTKLNRELSEIKITRPSMLDFEAVESTMNISSEMELILKNRSSNVTDDILDESQPSTSLGKQKSKLKSNLKQTGVQTEDKVRDKSLKVKIDSHTNILNSKISLNIDPENLKENKETQTSKEKQE